MRLPNRITFINGVMSNGNVNTRFPPLPDYFLVEIEILNEKYAILE